MEEDRFACLSLSRFPMENIGLSEEATDIIEAFLDLQQGKYQGHMYKFSQY